jgi:hypothetical protein
MISTVTTTWEQDGYLLRWDVQPNWTWQDFDAAFKAVKEQEQTLDHKFVEIFVLPVRMTIPMQFLTTAKGYLAKAPSQSEMAIMVCRDRLAEGMMETLRMFGELRNYPPREDYQFKVTHDLDKAYGWANAWIAKQPR